MDLEQLNKIIWWAYAIGYGFAIAIGQLLINPLINLMYDLVEKDFKKEAGYEWQAFIIGFIERIMYISALLMGHVEFIGLWVTLKVAIPYIRWIDPKIDEMDPRMSRSLFMNSLYGNALSILYAVVGYLMILWLNKGNYLQGILIPTILCILNIGLLVYLKIHQKCIKK